MNLLSRVVYGLRLRTGLFIACVLLGVQSLTRPHEVRDELVPVLLRLQARYPFRWRRWSNLWWGLGWTTLTVGWLLLA